MKTSKVVGGESGAKARPFRLEWAEDVVRQGKDTGTACFVKQMGQHAYSEKWFPGSNAATQQSIESVHEFGPKLKFIDYKGGDPAEWPEHLRVQEFPKVQE